MTVKINGFEMPKNPDECPFCDYEEGLCLVDYGLTTNGIFRFEARRCANEENIIPSWCPLIEVKTGTWSYNKDYDANECSHCGQMAPYKTPFCPNCGNPMEVEE